MKQSELFRAHPEYKHPKPPPDRLKLTPWDPSENNVRDTCLEFLKLHPQVAKVWRQNTGAGRFIFPDGKTSQFMRFGYVGQPDLGGYMIDGKLLLVETKKRTGRKSDDQIEVIAHAHKHGCVAFFARSVTDVIAGLRSHGYDRIDRVIKTRYVYIGKGLPRPFDLDDE